MLYRSYIDANFHVGQIVNNPLRAGINGFGNYQGSMVPVEVSRQVSFKLLLKRVFQST